MDKIAVMIPCYNEGSTIRKVVTDFKRVLPEAVIYVYDNNSTDHTDQIAADAGAVVRYEYRQGKGNVVRRMFQEIDAECYIMVDGDDTYPAETAREMADAVVYRQADMVVGDRLSCTYFTENKRRFHNFGNKLVRKSINLLFHNDILDIMTGYRAFSYRFVKTFPVLSRGFEIETEMSIHSVDANLNIAQVPVSYRERPLGSTSKLNTYTDGWKVLKTIGCLFRLYRPYAFFSMVSIVLAAVALILLCPIFVTFAKTGEVPRFPTMICCCCMILAALQSFFTGLQLQNLRYKGKQDFEMNLMRVMQEERCRRQEGTAQNRDAAK